MPRGEAPDAWGPGGFLEVAPELQVDHGGSDLETLVLRPAHNHSPRGHPQSSGMTSVPTCGPWSSLVAPALSTTPSTARPVPSSVGTLKD